MLKFNDSPWMLMLTYKDQPMDAEANTSRISLGMAALSGSHCANNCDNHCATHCAKHCADLSANHCAYHCAKH